MRARLSLPYLALLGGAVVVNAAGYLLTMWHEETLFDEAVHLYTSFAVVASIGRLAVGPSALPDRWASWWALLMVAVVLGLAWEMFEWAIGIIGTPRDTIVDLVMDSAGGALAAALIPRIRRRASR